MPGLLKWFVETMLSGSRLDQVSGDFEEEYNEILRDSGYFKANYRMIGQILKAIPSLIEIMFYGSIAMLRNYLKIMFRNLSKQKLYSFINLSGLTLGMTCSILIFIFIRYELSYDRFHDDTDDIFRIVLQQRQTDNNGWWYGTSAIMAPTLLQDFPDIEYAVRYSSGSYNIKCNNEKFWESGFFFADPEFLDLFEFPLEIGDPEYALKEPNSVVITKEMKEKYFDDVDPLGEVLEQYYNGKYHTFMVTGVLKDIPENTHFDFKFLASFESLRTMVANPHDWFTKWGYNNLSTFVKIRKYVDPFILEEKLSDYGYMVNTMNVSYHIQPVTNIHLQGKTFGGAEAERDLGNIYIFAAVAVFIIIIACFNYINLTTARFKKRAKEVGMRKVIGAGRGQIILQFLGESVVMSFTALAFSTLIIAILIKPFGITIGRELSLKSMADPGMLVLLISLTLLTGIISGIYPSLFLSSFQPAKIIKGVFASSTGNPSFFRNSLVTIQFGISTILIICIMLTLNQLNYMKTKKIGYEKEHIIILGMGDDIKKEHKTIRSELMKNPDIMNVSASAGSPVSIGWYEKPVWRGLDPNKNIFIPRLVGDRNIVDLYGFELIEGRNFHVNDESNSEVEYILNETAVKTAGWDDPIGKDFGFRGELNGKVIGVVKDFHTSSMRREIGPVVIELGDLYYFYCLSIKVSGSNIPENLEYIKKVYESFSPEFAFNFTFLDETVDDFYRNEERLSTVFGYFTALAIFITCLGLFGLASFTTESRRKEVGVKKVLGAAVSQIVGIFIREFILLMIVGNAIAWPVAYYAMDKWLQNFAYSIKPDIMVFAAASVISLLITVFSIGYQVLRAAYVNPIESLRYE